jgi:type III pantothenate kinase
MIGSVTTEHESFIVAHNSKFKIYTFKADTPVPLKNLYKSALTLGSDRLAASVGSYFYFPDKNVLTIDAGTCIKYNFVNIANEYLGGAISPGILMRLKSMHENTSALPIVTIDTSYTRLIGTSTTESILSGAMIGAACEIDGMIERYKSIYPGLQVVLTGGDAPYLSGQLKNRFFANQNILLTGLNAILNSQIEK